MRERSPLSPSASQPVWSLVVSLRTSFPARRSLAQMARFGLIGVLNTGLDILQLNLLLWLFAIHTLRGLFVANALAYGMGAVNSFLWNKYWTFHQRGERITRGEVARFALVTVCGMGINTLLLGLATAVLVPVMGSTTLCANLAKLVAVGGTMFLSFLGMRLWVFAHRPALAHPQPPHPSLRPVPVQHRVGSTGRRPQRTHPVRQRPRRHMWARTDSAHPLFG